MNKYSFIALCLLLALGSCKTQKNTSNATETVETRDQRKPNRSGERRGPPNIEEVFKMDKNQDGLLAKSEVNGKLLENFSTFDSNKDGFISREEFKNAPKPERRPRGGRKN